MTVRIPPISPSASSEVWTIDFRETAPAASNTTMFIKEPMKALFGGLSVGVPGELRGLEEAHKRWGSLPWKTLVTPSVELAKGWKMQQELAGRIRIEVSRCVLRTPFANGMLETPALPAADARESRLERYLCTEWRFIKGGSDNSAYQPIANSRFNSRGGCRRAISGEAQCQTIISHVSVGVCCTTGSSRRRTRQEDSSDRRHHDA